MTRRRSYHHGNLKDALLDAAVALIAEAGPQSFTLREVARRAGVSHNAPYRHFRDKEEVLAAVAAQGFARLTEAMNAAAAGGATAVERWILCGRGYIEFALEWPQHFTAMFDAALPAARDSECAAAGEAAFHTLLSYIAAAQAEGGLKAGDPLPLALVSWSIVHGLAKLAISERLPMKREQVLGFYREFASEAMRHGLAGRGKEPGKSSPRSR